MNEEFTLKHNDKDFTFSKRWICSISRKISILTSIDPNIKYYELPPVEGPIEEVFRFYDEELSMEERQDINLRECVFYNYIGNHLNLQDLVKFTELHPKNLYCTEFICGFMKRLQKANLPFDKYTNMLALNAKDVLSADLLMSLSIELVEAIISSPELPIDFDINNLILDLINSNVYFLPLGRYLNYTELTSKQKYQYLSLPLDISIYKQNIRSLLIQKYRKSQAQAILYKKGRYGFLNNYNFLINSYKIDNTFYIEIKLAYFLLTHLRFISNISKKDSNWYPILRIRLITADNKITTFSRSFRPGTTEFIVSFPNHTYATKIECTPFPIDEFDEDMKKDGLFDIFGVLTRV